MADALMFERGELYNLGHKERLAVPRLLRALAAWLEHAAEIDGDTARALVARVDEREQEFIAREARVMRRARWSERMRDVVPLPSAPCPCGSGAAYRECCA